MADLSVLEWLARAVTGGAALLLFGATIFVLYLPRQQLRTAGEAGLAEWRALHRLALGVEIGCVVALVLAGALGLALHAAAIAGVPVGRIFASAQAGVVLRETLFGRVSVIRLALVVVLAMLLVPGRRPAAVRPVASIDLARAVLAGVVLATLPWTGHAVASSGVDRYAQVASDTLHLVAAGAWLGALPLLALMLFRAAATEAASIRAIVAQTTERFSRLGMVCVAVLVATGTIGMWYLVGRPAALFGTHYGQLLLVKLALFAAMVLYAAGNRFRHTPRIRDPSSAATDSAPRAALLRIARNAVRETALGLAIVALVGVLGASSPAAHAVIDWPLPFTFDWDVAASGNVSGWRVSALLAGCVATFLLVRIAARRRRFVERVLAIAASALPAVAGAGWLFAVPAHATTYAQPTVRYTAQSIARGFALFAEHCAACHGADAKGGGTAPASLPPSPANLLAERTPARRPGDLFWRVSHGVSGTPMPGFADRLSVTQRWDEINFLRARGDGERALALAPDVAASPYILAPDFAFELERGLPETLGEQRGRSAVLLVFYTLPASAKRLAALAAAREHLEHSSSRIVAFPLRAMEASDTERAGVAPTIFAMPDPAVVTAYALFLHASSAAGEPAHAELLIDRSGYVRARWLFAGEVSDDPVPELLRAVERIGASPATAAEATMHQH